MSDFRDQVTASLETAQRIIEGLSPILAGDDEDDIALHAQNGMQQRCAFIIEQVIANVRAGRPANAHIVQYVRRENVG